MNFANGFRRACVPAERAGLQAGGRSVSVDMRTAQRGLDRATPDSLRPARLRAAPTQGQRAGMAAAQGNIMSGVDGHEVCLISPSRLDARPFRTDRCLANVSQSLSHDVLQDPESESSGEEESSPETKTDADESSEEGSEESSEESSEEESHDMVRVRRRPAIVISKMSV